jgi:hypothetical protein
MAARLARHTARGRPGARCRERGRSDPSFDLWRERPLPPGRPRVVLPPARAVPGRCREIIDDLTRRQVKLSFGGSVHDPADPVGRLLFNVLAMVADFEADLIRLRTREGMKVAKAKGRLRGKQPKLNARQEAHLAALQGRRAQHRRARRPVRRRPLHGVPRHRTRRRPPAQPEVVAGGCAATDPDSARPSVITIDSSSTYDGQSLAPTLIGCPVVERLALPGR